MRTTLFASLVLVGLTSIALATPTRLHAAGGSAVTIRLADARLPAIALSAAPGRAYRLRLVGVERGLATLTDLTDGAPRTETDLVVRRGELLLSPPELTPGHAYRVRVTGVEGTVVVWLRPPHAPGSPTRLRFDARDLAAPPATSSDELAPVPKRL